jgi:hypothetical protein
MSTKSPKKTSRSPRSAASKRSVRALRIYDALRTRAPPGTVIVLANSRPAESQGQGANFLDVYHVSRPRTIVRGQPSAVDGIHRKDANKQKVKKSFAKSAKWMRYLTVFSADGQVQASTDLDGGSRLELASAQQQQQTQQQQQKTDDDGDAGSIVGWVKANWKMASAGVLVVLFLLFGLWSTFGKKK